MLYVLMAVRERRGVGGSSGHLVVNVGLAWADCMLLSVGSKNQRGTGWGSLSYRWCCSVAGGEQVSKLIVLDFAGVVLIDVVDELLNVNGHFELLLDNFDELCGIDVAITIRFAAHSDEGVKGVFLVGGTLVFLLFRDHVLELRVADFSSVLGIGFCDHPENLFFSGLLTHHLEHNSELVGVDLTTAVLVEGGERLPALGLFLFGESFNFSCVFWFLQSCHFQCESTTCKDYLFI